MTIKVITEELVAEISRSYPTLNALNLSSNEICEIQNLSPLGALVALNLSNNSLSELGGIGNKILPNLRQLDVSNNRMCVQQLRTVVFPLSHNELDAGSQRSGGVR